MDRGGGAPIRLALVGQCSISGPSFFEYGKGFATFSLEIQVTLLGAGSFRVKVDFLIA